MTALEEVERHPAVDETAKHFDLGCDDEIRPLHNHHWGALVVCSGGVGGVLLFRWFWGKETMMMVVYSLEPTCSVAATHTKTPGVNTAARAHTHTEER